MSEVAELIAKYCPEGVMFKSLGELGIFYGGLTGKSKDDFKDGNVKFITYKNVYSNPALKLDVDDTVKITDDEKQHTLQYGDVIFTGSSETPDECGISSVVTIVPEEKFFLNSFCFFFRFYDTSIMLPNFAKHLFRSNELRYQISKTASGVTRYNVSQKLMEKVVIPIPPLEVQQEIVRILDSFTELIVELTTELTARKQQYEYYRDELLTFNTDADGVVWQPFGEIATISRGASPRPIKKFITEAEDGVNWIKIGDVLPNTKYVSATKEKITPEGAEKSRRVNSGDFILSNSMSFGRPYILKIDGCIHDGWLSISGFEEYATPDYLYYVLISAPIQKEMEKKASFGGAVQNLNAEIVRDIKIPLPPLSVQKRLANILDHFDVLCNDLTNGLPAEIEARQKQYEYYRDKLLTFKKLA